MRLFGPPNVTKLREKGDVSGLAKALGYPNDANVRRSAALALGEIDDVRVVEPLVDALRDEHATVRQAAAEALEQAAWDAQNEADRAALLIATCKWDDLRALGEHAVPPLVEFVLDAGLGSTEEEWVGASTTLTFRFGPGLMPIAVRRGRVTVRETPDGGRTIDVAAGSVISAGTLADEEWFSISSPEFSAPSTSVDSGPLLSMVAVLRDIGAPAIAPLMDGLDDGDSSVKQNASWALVEIGEPALDPVLGHYLPRLMDDLTIDTTVFATIALIAKAAKQRGELGLIDHLKTYEGEMKTGVVQVLASLADESAEWDELLAESGLQPNSAATVIGTAPDSVDPNAIDLLIQSPLSSATYARFREGPSAEVLTTFLVHEDRQHVDRLPEQVPIAIRASLFVREGVGLVVVMLGVGDDVYETWWNVHNPAYRACFDDVCEQDKLLVSFYIDRAEPERTLWIPNTLRARFREMLTDLERMESWEMAAFDRARAKVYVEYPTPQALWASMDDVGSAGLGSESIAREPG